jgi:hypothetical protein
MPKTQDQIGGATTAPSVVLSGVVVIARDDVEAMLRMAERYLLGKQPTCTDAEMAAFGRIKAETCR